MTNLFSSLVFRGKEAVLETEDLLRKYSDSSGNQSSKLTPTRGGIQQYMPSQMYQ